MAIYTKRYNGSSWVTTPVKRYNGSSWVNAYVYKWNGSGWSQLHPDTTATVTKSYASTSFNTYRSKWDSDNVAKQGKYSSYAAAHGYLGVSCSRFTGYGSVSSISSANYSTTRDGSGYYNNNQTVYFYRSNVAPTGSSPVNTVTGSWTSTTGGPGSGGSISNRAITVNDNMKNWMNNVSSKPYLYIYSSASGDYLGFKTKFTLSITYTYVTASAIFAEDGTAMAYNASTKEFLNEGGALRDIYHRMPVYENELGMTLDEILERREKGIVEDIDPTTVDDDPVIMPWTREYEVYTENNRDYFRIEVLNLRKHDIAQFSLDKEKWYNLKGDDPKSNYVKTMLPINFNKYSDYVYMRIYDKEHDQVMTYLEVEPKIYLPNQKNKGIVIPGPGFDLDDFMKNNK